MIRHPSPSKRSSLAVWRHLSRRLPPLITAVLLSLVVAGCAGGEQGAPAAASPGHPPHADQVRLVVSRDFGAAVMTDLTVTAHDDLSVMRLLAENAEVETAYGGGFVTAIDGLASTFGSVGEAEAKDWFYWVDGVMADVGAADNELRGGETVWWDYHAWQDAMYLPAAVFALPAPWNRGALDISMNGSDAAVRDWAETNGLTVGATHPLGDREASGMVVATAAEVRCLPWLKTRLSGRDGGVELAEATERGLELKALDGTTGPLATGVFLALPDPSDPRRPVLVLLAGSAADTEQLLRAVSPQAVRAHLGVALVDGSLTGLPWQSR